MEHLPGYAQRDWRIVDYHLYCLPNTDLWFRGPKPGNLQRNNYFACIGAAQTFGCFCDKPYPILLKEKIDLDVLNLGYGGAGPFFFLKHAALLEYVNNARFAIILVMSGRSESNSLFHSGGLEYLTRLSDGVRIGADAAYQDLLRKHARWRIKLGGKQISLCFLARNRVKRIVTETRANWTRNFTQLIHRIKVPKILFYFSRREPGYQECYDGLQSLFSGFPQLVNSQMIHEVRRHCDHYVECISKRGTPQLLVDRFTGKPTTVDLSLDREDFHGLWEYNLYYPTPEMHVDAARVLEPVCARILGQ